MIMFLCQQGGGIGSHKIQALPGTHKPDDVVSYSIIVVQAALLSLLPLILAKLV